VTNAAVIRLARMSLVAYDPLYRSRRTKRTMREQRSKMRKPKALAGVANPGAPAR